MIISKEVEVLLDNRNRKRLIRQYNIKGQVGEVIKIPIDKLFKSSNYLIDAKCDYCGSLNKLPYKRYNKSLKVVNKYACKNQNCCNKKLKDVNNTKYNVDNVFQSPDIKNKIKQTNLEKYGVEHPMHSNGVKEKIKQTNLEKYGVTSYTKTNEYREKSKKTNLEKYGTEFSLQNEEVKKKVKQTNLEKYGVEHPSKSKMIRAKTEETNLEKYGYKCNLSSPINKEKVKKTMIENHGVYNPMLSEEIRKKYYKIANDEHYLKYISDNISLFKCDNNLNHQFEISSHLYVSRMNSGLSLCTICNPVNSFFVSGHEKEIFEYIKNVYSGEIIQSYRDNMEIDIFIPEMLIGFEFNGLYWHSEFYKDKYYHRNKSIYFNEKNIRIIHIWEDDWIYRKNIIKSQILNWLNKTPTKIYARKTEIKEITDVKIVRNFLEKNHIQGNVSSSVKLGLYYNHELISLMLFDQFEGRKKISSDGYNLCRFCNKINTTVIGGASKLFNYFIKKYQPKRIISYSDKSWSNGNLYEKMGFKLIKELNVDYKYVIGDKRINKSKFRKSNLNTTLSETDYMRKENIPKIWDLGKNKYEIIFQ